MRYIKIATLLISILVATISCGNNGANQGASTPIDSTNVKSAAPATYGGNNPANDQTDTNKTNINDTGTKANNIHKEGTR